MAVLTGSERDFSEPETDEYPPCRHCGDVHSDVLSPCSHGTPGCVWCRRCDAEEEARALADEADPVLADDDRFDDEADSDYAVDRGYEAADREWSEWKDGER